MKFNEINISAKLKKVNSQNPVQENHKKLKNSHLLHIFYSSINDRNV